MIRVFSAKELIKFFIKIMIPVIMIWLVINSISNVRGTAKFINSKVLFSCLDEHFEKIKTSTIDKNSNNEKGMNEGNYEDEINGTEGTNNEDKGQTGTTNNNDLQTGMTNNNDSQIKSTLKYVSLIAKELPVIKSISTESSTETKTTDEIKIAEENENAENKNDQTKEERK